MTEPHTTRALPARPTKAHLRALPNSSPGRNAPGRKGDRTASKKEYAEKLLKRTGFRLGDEGAAAARDVKKAAKASSSIGSTDLLGDVGGFGVTIVAGILGLLFLDVLISGRGSTITGKTVTWISSALGRLVNPTDPIVGGGGATVAPSSSVPATSSTPAPGVGAIGGQASSALAGRPPIVPLSPFPAPATPKTPIGAGG